MDKRDRVTVILPRQLSGNQAIVVRGADGVLRSYDSVDSLPESAKASATRLLEQRSSVEDSQLPVVAESEFKLHYRWWHTRKVFWDTIAMFLFAAAMVVGMTVGLDGAAAGLLLWLLASLAIVCAYRLLGKLLNCSEITIKDNRLTIRHRPIPWFGCSIPTEDIAQVFAAIAHGRRGRIHISVNAAIRTSGGLKQRTLLSVHSEREAAWLERQLEKQLGIRDWPDFRMESWI